MERYSIITVTRDSDKIFFLLSEMYGIFDHPFLDKHYIVDNNSSQEFKSHLKSIISKINKKIGNETLSLIERDKNYLFTSSNNIVLKDFVSQNNKKSKYVILMNPDIVLNTPDNDLDKPCIIQRMIEMCCKNKIQIAGCRLDRLHGTIEFAGGKDNSHVGYNVSINDANKGGIFKSLEETEWITGAFMIIDTDILPVVGILDSRFTHWVSDQEFCRRAGLLGIKSWMLPFNIIHEQGTSTVKSNHVVCFEDLPDGLIPNAIPVGLQEILDATKINANNAKNGNLILE